MSPARVRIAIVAFFTLMITSGVNLSFGLFLAPLAREFGGSRAAVSLAATTNLVLFGAMQPFFGGMIDRFGPRLVVIASVLLMSIGALAMSQAGALWHLYVSYGVVGGIGFTGAGILSVSVLILRWFRRSRGTALTVIATGSSLGQAIFYQLASWSIAVNGWRVTSVLFGALLIALVPAWLALVRNDPPEVTATPPRPDAGAAAGPTLGAVVTASPFLLLAAAYLTCGFTDFMITTHLAPLAADRGFGLAAGARALSVLALANVVGLLVAGRLADRTSNRMTLVAVYAVRAVALVLLVVWTGRAGLYGFAFMFGLTFFTTAPLTSALVNELYGVALTGRVFGAANAVHHLAGAAGAYLAGQAFDLTGSYTLVFAAGAVSVLAATALTSRIAVPRARAASR